MSVTIKDGIIIIIIIIIIISFALSIGI